MASVPAVLFRSKVPAETVVNPEYVFAPAPEKVRMPAPLPPRVRFLLAPLMMLLIVMPPTPSMLMMLLVVLPRTMPSAGWQPHSPK